MKRSRSLVIATMGVLAVGTAACGSDGTTTSAGNGSNARTVEIAMADNTFSPDTITVTRGETVRFVFTNSGNVAHDAFIGDAAAQDGHEMDMHGGDDGMGHGDEGSDAITVDPGDTGELTHTFDDTGTLEVGCHQTGHYADGMKLSITVT